MIHSINVFIHVSAGSLALLLGLLAIFSFRRDGRHKLFGRGFSYLMVIVVTTSFIGWLFFRPDPLLLMLTLLSGYVTYSGFKAITRRVERSSTYEAALALAVLSSAIVYLGWMHLSYTTWSKSVVLSAVVAIILVTGYDIAKHFWLHRQLKDWWLYEHIYKMISGFSAILSAFTGTVFPNSKPYSQLAPSVVCTLLAVSFIAWYAKRKNRFIAPVI